MPPGGAFLALKEYRPDSQLRPGVGLFAPGRVSLPLTPGHFHPRALQVGRAGQAGFQHFFTASGRPLCLYAVIATGASGSVFAAAAHDRVGQLSGVLSTLKVEKSP
jgi:hypothetical protein